ncbi:MAG: hypothetical protein Q8K35_07285 [Thiobacillus sp.]|nr:hypothetical protein [Thiobacillus sp.]MDP2057547.1 hypothetical protein [Thiobacillus sp.]
MESDRVRVLAIMHGSVILAEWNSSPGEMGGEYRVDPICCSPSAIGEQLGVPTVEEKQDGLFLPQNVSGPT